MFFGLPWWAIIPIVAIVGGMILEYRKNEMKHEEKMRAGSQEIQELRKILHNLKSRIEHLEAIVTEEREMKKDVPLDDIEVKDDYYPNEGNTNQPGKIKN